MNLAGNFLPQIRRTLRRALVKSHLLSTAPMELPQREWAIGIYHGQSPFELRPSVDRNPVLTRRDVVDVQAAFVADPFMIAWRDTWYMFFEVLNCKTHKGEIAMATSRNGIDWAYQRIVLVESFHLSYPYVFEVEGIHYLVPESSGARDLRLYRAEEFPHRWRLESTLLKAGSYVDSSLVFHNNYWWIFAEGSEPPRHDTLRLFYSRQLLGPWQEHPKSPVIVGNPQIARPGGRVVSFGERLVRYAQDCSAGYGVRLRAFEILELSPTQYREKPSKPHVVLEGNGMGWNGSGMHHVDPHQRHDGSWFACVDGRSMGTSPD